MELLLPAGDMERLKFALAFGADAVYAGVPRYSLRTRENGFDEKSIKEAIDYTHEVGKKIYLAMNIFPHNNKVDGLLDAFCRFYSLNPDGFIVADIGAISKMLKLRPDAAIHLSTQANATNWSAVEFYRDMGVKRVILPRELSLREISYIKEKVNDIELEAFVHGSMCMAYSGRCLISNYLTHRDSNQGNCANSCRWQYKVSANVGSLRVIEEENAPVNKFIDSDDEYFVTEKERPDELFPLSEDENGTFLFNSKDLCAVELLEQLKNAGIVSAKVEGRTKSLYYVSMVARAYRRAIDDLSEGRAFNPEILRELIATSNRSLMTGFFLRRPNEYGQNYEDGFSSALTHEFVGKVSSFDKNQGVVWIESRNKISRGDEVEFVSPNGTRTVVVNELISEKERHIDQIAGGIIGGLPISFEPHPFTVIRREKIEIGSLKAISNNTAKSMDLR